LGTAAAVAARLIIVSSSTPALTAGRSSEALRLPTSCAAISGENIEKRLRATLATAVLAGPFLAAPWQRRRRLGHNSGYAHRHRRRRGFEIPIRFLGRRGNGATGAHLSPQHDQITECSRVSDKCRA
jgi:hypothetical protein